MKFVQRKATTAKSKEVIADFNELKKSFLAVASVSMEDISPKLVLNWDQTGLKIIPSSTWTMERQGAKRAEMVAVNDKAIYMYDKVNPTTELITNSFVLMIIYLCHLYHNNIVSYMYVKSDTIHQRRVWGQT